MFFDGSGGYYIRRIAIFPSAFKANNFIRLIGELYHDTKDFEKTTGGVVDVVFRNDGSIAVVYLMSFDWDPDDTLTDGLGSKFPEFSCFEAGLIPEGDDERYENRIHYMLKEDAVDSCIKEP